MNTSKMFTLNLKDVARGLVVAVLTGLALPILAVIQTPGFDFTAVNWNQVFVLAVNGGLAGLAGYLTKNFFSNSQNQFGGVVG